MDRHVPRNRNRRHQLAAGIAAAYVVVTTAPAAFAASAGMPWESPLQKLVQSLTGPVAKAIGIAAIVIAALGMAISEGGHTLKTFLKILLGLSIAFTAGTFGLQLAGFTGGLLL
jgi:type IV secretion system protein VirB2